MVDEKCHYQRDGHISKTCKWLNILGVGIGVLCEAYIYKAASPLNSCDKRRKNSMSETRTEPRRANPKLRVPAINHTSSQQPSKKYFGQWKPFFFLNIMTNRSWNTETRLL